MHIGMQMIAPAGFGQLLPDEVYHFLDSDGNRDRVRFIQFTGKHGIQLLLLTMSRMSFEDGLISQQIISAEKQSLLPPWLSELEGFDFSSLDARRANAKEKHRNRVEARLLQIQPLVERAKEIVRSEKPDKTINDYVRSSGTSLNESRVRRWFYTYIIFGRNIWTLMPPFQHIGKWSRQERFPHKKFGCPSKRKGRAHCYPVDDEMKLRIRDYFLKYSMPGIPLSKVYVVAMDKGFGCKIAVDRKTGLKVFIHPEGAPFPTNGQFRYWVGKLILRKEIEDKIYGSTRRRAKQAVSEGRFGQVVANLLERVELDGYYTSARPSGVVEGTALPALCVVRIVCVLSKRLVGIGFSYGKERAAAYRMALFCMAIDKKLFCRLFGKKLRDGDWLGAGLPLMGTLDRGPGGGELLIQEADAKFAIRELSPSWQGQSKASIESSHPRDMALEGQPTYLHSKFNPVEMARQAIDELIRDNSVSDISDHLTPEMITAGVHPNPSGIWNYLEARGRIDAQPISLEDAVRAFLEPVKLKLRTDGLYLGRRRFDSREMRELGIFDVLAASQKADVDGYVLSMCVRHIWADVGGRLFLMDAMLPIRDGDEQLYVTLSELREETNACNAMQADFGEHKSAVEVECRQRFKAETGVDFDSAVRKVGRPRKNAISRREEADMRQALP